MKNRASNIHIIIQARMNATRIPGKVLKNLGGFPMLYHVTQRCRNAKKANKIIVATTLSSFDDPIVNFCQKNDINYFRGSEENVLKRYYDCASHFKSEVIVRICADNPLVDPVIIDACIQEFNDSNTLDYVSSSPAGGFPLGINVEVFSFKALEKAYNCVRNSNEKEHVTPYIWQNKNKEFNTKSLAAPPEYVGNYRLTVDYPEDFQLMETLYEKFGKAGLMVNLATVIKFLGEHPEISAINSNCEQKPTGVAE